MKTMALGVLALIFASMAITVFFSAIGWAKHLQNEKNSDVL